MLYRGATGDGITIAVEDGAALVDMEQIQTHPTVNPDTQTMYTEGVRGNGAILVNKEGKHFVNELETRDVVSAAILEQTDKQCYLVFDQAVRDSLSAIESYVKAGIVFEADTPEALGEEIGADGAALCVPAVHHTMGGVKINTNTEVLKEDGTAIPGLFAAGEITGGVHGANRLGGNAVTDIVVFGRIAGTAAEKYVVDNGGNTEQEITVAAGEETVTPEIIKKQTAEVDAVSGATNTSNGIMEAVAEALSTAK